MDVFQNKLALLKEAQKLDTFHPYKTCQSPTTLELPFFFFPPAYGENGVVVQSHPNQISLS